MVAISSPAPGKDTFHTCNLKAVLAPHFTRGYETLLRSRVSTAFVVLTPHCGAKFVQCETSGVCLLLLDAWQQTANQKLSSEALVTKRGSCKLQPVRSSVARLGGFEFDCAGKYWLGRVDKIWAGFWSVWRFSKHINCID